MQHVKRCAAICEFNIYGYYLFQNHLCERCKDVLDQDGINYCLVRHGNSKFCLSFAITTIQCVGRPSGRLFAGLPNAVNLITLRYRS